MEDKSQIELLISSAENELAELDLKRNELIDRIKGLKKSLTKQPSPTQRLINDVRITRLSSEKEKITLFRSLFRGREDVFPKRFESKKTGKSGYQPLCRHEWIRSLCQKPKIKCAECNNRHFIPVTDDIIQNHLLGKDPDVRSDREFTIGVYPLLEDESCWLLAADFDKATWREDVAAFFDTCQSLDVPVALERSRSGNGCHAWIFFSEPISANLARKLGSLILTQTMERRPEIGLDSYDRFFPSQDTMPKGGFGNLIALPLQRTPRENGNSLFINKNLIPYEDQWSFLSSIRRMSFNEVENIVGKSFMYGGIIGVKMVATDENDDKPWLAPPSRRTREIPIKGPLPDHIDIILGNQIYIEKKIHPPALLNRLIRIAAFQNPEFYKTQAMRFSTFNKPRIINCCEEFPKHIGIPIGCLDEVTELLNELRIEARITDERFSGNPLDINFVGALRPDQMNIVDAMSAQEIGVLSASTAFGKTVIAIYLICMRKVNTLILVNRKELLKQ